MKRCLWCNLNNPLYVEYHDKEWGVLNLDDNYLFEMLILEMFQAGLSWECILNKRENFKRAYDNFAIDKIIKYDDVKKEELYNNKGIIRNKLKINASINNSAIFKEIQKEYGSFSKYLLSFIHWIPNIWNWSYNISTFWLHIKRFDKTRYEIYWFNNYIFLSSSNRHNKLTRNRMLSS